MRLASPTSLDFGLLTQKLLDAEQSGAPVELDPEEAQAAGAFSEDALA